MLKIRFYRKTLFLYFVLFTACFNDVLRIGENKLTLFRIVIFAGLLLCLSYMRKTLGYLLAFAIFSVISFFQSIYFADMNGLGISISIRRFAQYDYYYLCIVIVVCIVRTLWHLEGDLFFQHFRKFLLCVSMLYLIIFGLIGLGLDVSKMLFVNNINDYGAVLAAVFPFFCVDLISRHDVKCGIIAFLIFFFLAINDCKLALLGVVFEVFILCYLYLGQKSKNLRAMWAVVAIAFFCIIVCILNNQDVSLHGYTFSSSVMAPVRRVMQGEMYDQSNTSVTYRTNVMIIGVVWLMKTKFLGIGMGNAGVLMRQVLGNYNLYERFMHSDAVSVHNSLLEFLLEFGFLALIVVFLFARDIIRLLGLKQLTNDQIIYISIIVSSILWIQGPSGILTDYYIFILLAYLVFKNSAGFKKQKKY